MDPDAVDDFCDDPSGEHEGERQESTHSGRVHHGGADDPQVLDFSANTNPRTPDGVTRVYESALGAARSYPADDYAPFRVAAAEYVGCEPSMVVPTAGGLAAIRLTIATAVEPGDSVLVPYPSFGEYAREVRLQGGEPTFVHYEDLLDVDPGEFALAIVCTPNNPTGDAYDPVRLRAYADECRTAGTPLLVDEAFSDFTGIDSLAGYDGTVVIRSLTKMFGLPGLRAGFAVATGRHRERLDTTRLTWGLGTPAAAVGTHCLDQHAFVSETRERVRTQREQMQTRLAERFDVFPSDAPFLLLELTDDSVDTVCQTVREEGIRVRDARTFRGLDNHIRVAVRLPEENERLLDALDV